METKEKNEQPTASESMRVEYTNAYILKGKTLQPFSTDAETAAKIAQDKQSLEKKFKSEKELAELVLNNGKILFGEKTILITGFEKNKVAFSGEFFPDGLLFDFSESEKPRLYFVEIILAGADMAELFYRMTNVFALFSNQERINLFLTTLSDAIRKNIGWRNKLKSAFGDKGIFEFLQKTLTSKPAILLVMDSFKQELTGFFETYTETWKKMIKPIIIRKFSIGKETIFTMVPTLEQLSSQPRNNKEVKVKSTEEDHLENVSETVKEIFLQIKNELQKADNTVEFRVKPYYISLRKNRNLAIFQLGKKKVCIVIVNPEKNTRKQLRHHETRSHADSVKRYWNGNEHCFTVVIENKEHLSEITQLLKKLVADGNSEEGSDETAAENTAAEKTKSQAKPKRKGKK